MSVNQTKATHKQVSSKNLSKQEGFSLIEGNIVLVQQIISVLKLRLSIANIEIPKDTLNKQISDYINRIDITYLNPTFINKIVEDIFNTFSKETKQKVITTSVIDTTLSSIPSNQEAKWDNEPILLKNSYLLTDPNSNSTKKKSKPATKQNIPMKFTKDKEISIPQPVFFLDNDYGRKHQKCIAHSLIPDIDIDAMNERIIDQIMSKATPS